MSAELMNAEGAEITLHGISALRSGRCQWMLEELGVK